MKIQSTGNHFDELMVCLFLFFKKKEKNPSTYMCQSSKGKLHRTQCFVRKCVQMPSTSKMHLFSKDPYFRTLAQDKLWQHFSCTPQKIKIKWCCALTPCFLFCMVSHVQFLDASVIFFLLWLQFATLVYVFHLKILLATFHWKFGEYEVWKLVVDTRKLQPVLSWATSSSW